MFGVCPRGIWFGQFAPFDQFCKRVISPCSVAETFTAFTAKDGAEALISPTEPCVGLWRISWRVLWDALWFGTLAIPSGNVQQENYPVLLVQTKIDPFFRHRRSGAKVFSAENAGLAVVSAGQFLRWNPISARNRATRT
jgi:hypothetical protein